MAKKNSIAGLTTMVKLQTKLFKNVCADFSEEYAQKTLSKDTAHIAWIAGHLVSSRYALAGLFGADVKEPFPDVFGQGKGMDQSLSYPSMADLLKDWNSVSEKLSERLESLSDDELSASAPYQFPIEDSTMLGLLVFFVHHEAYHIGQIGIARKFFGFDALAYK